MLEIQEDVVDTFIRYGLFIGALFQLACIGAILIMPESSSLYHVESENGSEDENNDNSSDHGSPTVSPNHNHQNGNGKKLNGNGKKKRR